MTATNHSPGHSASSRITRLALMLLLLPLSLLSFSGARAQSGDDDERSPRQGNIQARGCFTCDFTIPGNSPLDVAQAIKRDRMYMAERPGMQRKQIPLGFVGNANHDLFSGGRYLFDTRHQAEAYKSWVEDDYLLDGTHFFDR